jgi:hypothetical protein
VSQRWLLRFDDEIRVMDGCVHGWQGRESREAQRRGEEMDGRREEEEDGPPAFRHDEREMSDE